MRRNNFSENLKSNEKQNHNNQNNQTPSRVLQNRNRAEVEMQQMSPNLVHRANSLHVHKLNKSKMDSELIRELARNQNQDNSILQSMDRRLMDEFLVPPDRIQMKDYKKSTNFGYANNQTRNICLASGLSTSNKRFSFNDSTQKYQINGKGYSLFFRITKLMTVSLIVGFLPLAITLMVLFNSGDDCYGQKKGLISSLFEPDSSDPSSQAVSPANGPGPHSIHQFLKTAKMNNSAILKAKRLAGESQRSADQGLDGLSIGKKSRIRSHKKIRKIQKEGLTESILANSKQRDGSRMSQTTHTRRSRDGTGQKAQKNHKKGDFPLHQKTIITRFSDDFKEVGDLFDPIDDISTLFNATMSVLTNNYIHRFFFRVCKVETQDYDDINKDYKQFCQKYLENKCYIRPESAICHQATLVFYETKNVKNHCYMTWANMISLSNRIEKADRVTRVDKMLPLIFTLIFLALVFALTFFFFWHERYSIELNSKTSTIRDFSLLVTDLPGVDTLQEETNLRENLEVAFLVSGYELRSVNFVYKTEEYLMLKNRKERLISIKFKEEYRMANEMGLNSSQNVQNMILQTASDADLLSDLQRQIEDTELQLKRLEARFDGDDVGLIDGKAFVCFNSGKERDECYAKYRKKGWLYKRIGLGFYTRDFLMLDIRGDLAQVFVELPDEPGDIIWENVNIRESERLVRKFASFGAGLLVLGVGFFGLYFLKTEKTIHRVDQVLSFELSTLKALNKEHIISLIVSIIISIISAVLKQVLKLLAKFEKHQSSTAFHLNLTKKLWKIQFINMAVIPFLISASMLNFFDLGGLIEEMNLIFLINATLPHLLVLFLDPLSLKKLVQRFLLKRFLTRKQFGPFNQRQANEIVSLPEYEISEAYSYTFSTVAAAVFYFSIFPLGVVYAVVSLIIHFFVQKWILIRRRSKIAKYSDLISRALVGDLQLLVVIYALGLVVEENITRIVDGQKNLGVSMKTGSMLIMSILIYFLNSKWYLGRCLPKINPPDITYNEMMRRDPTNYEFLNPATSELAKKRMRQALRDLNSSRRSPFD